MGTVELQITDVAFGGSGVARDNGKAVFVPFTIDGERVRTRITREKKQFAEAELVEVAEPSPHRTQPRCPYFGRCGGCAYQHISYKHQLELKTRQVADVLARIGKLSDVPIQPIIPSQLDYGYRNRITVHAQNGVIGFYRHNRHELIDITHCPISRSEVNNALAALRSRHVRDGHYTLRANRGPRIFEQINDAVADALRALIAQMLDKGGPLLIDAFCGAGFFAKPMATKFDRVVGIEWDRFAIEIARQNAWPNESYIEGEVAVELPALLRAAASLIVDPPNAGLDTTTRAAILANPPKNIIYLSCNPSTLARDLRELTSSFQVRSVIPLDMFPQTAEIEVLVEMTRQSSRAIAAQSQREGE